MMDSTYDIKLENCGKDALIPPTTVHFNPR